MCYLKGNIISLSEIYPRMVTKRYNIFLQIQSLFRISMAYKTFILLVLPSLLFCNIWDNIFSKPRSVPTIKFRQEFSAKTNTTYDDKSYIIEFDYNLNQLRANAALFTELDLIVTKQNMKVVTIEANFQKNILIVNTPISCNNYQLGLNLSLQKNQKSMKVLGSHLQLFFEYMTKEAQLYLFNFNPNLLNSFDASDVPKVVVFTNSEGQIQKIQFNDQKLDYEWKSHMKKLHCKGPIQKLSNNSDVRNMFDILKK